MEKVKEEFMVFDEVRNMKREDFAVLCNLERFRQGLSNSGKIKWDLEKVSLENQVKSLTNEN